ncbi:hypothetical protein [Bradyrhizobium sp. 195]|nr:hypothetical protein [Bradyrhizobium sp. 195]UPK25778.1 hypothetical protein IVB26_31445 [Bradyrhizobium sp. 195]
MIEGFFSLGQYSRIIRTKSPDGAGSHPDSISQRAAKISAIGDVLVWCG